MEERIITYVVYYFLLSPLAKILLLNVRYLIGGEKLEESATRTITKIGAMADFLVALTCASLSSPRQAHEFAISRFFLIGGEFPVTWDTTLLASLLFMTVILGVVGRFSVFYLHRDRYFHKFFTLYFIFQLAVALIIFSSSIEYLFMGWELLGLSSVLLIAFYEHRVSPLKNSLRILFVYKVGDFLLFSLMVVLLHMGLEDLDGILKLHQLGHDWVLALLLGACFIKSGVFPWHWLPRAMEGPTPSSAIFYGALATHIPVLVLLRSWPQDIPAAHPLVIGAITICIFSALTTNLLCRQASDAKNALAYATIAQLSLMYIEIFLGFHTLALVHCLMHGIFRSFEFLRAPSLLYVQHSMESARRSQTTERSHPLRKLLPEALNARLYALCINDFGYIPRLINSIDHFLGLVEVRFSARSTVRYTLWALGTWIIVDLALLRNMPSAPNWWEEFFLFLAFGFNVLAYANIYRPRWFLGATVLSTELILTILSVRTFAVLTASLWVFVILFVGLAYGTLRGESGDSVVHSFRARFHRSTWFTSILFVIALAIVAVPGLGNFFIWEFLVQKSTPLLPALVIRSFLLLTFNSLLVFLFFYVNFFGEPGRFTFVSAPASDDDSKLAPPFSDKSRANAI